MTPPRVYGRKNEEELERLLRPGLRWLSREGQCVFWGKTGVIRLTETSFHLETRRIRMRSPDERRTKPSGDASFGWRLDAGIGAAYLEPALVQTPENVPLPNAETLQELAEMSDAGWLAAASEHAPQRMKRLIFRSDFVFLSITYIGRAAIFLDPADG